MIYISIHKLLGFYYNVKNIKKSILLPMLVIFFFFFFDTYLQVFLKICIEHIVNKCIKEENKEE